MHASDGNALRPVERNGAERPAARAFGERAEDLDADFSAGSRPALVTEILRRSLQADAAPCDETEIWSWTLPERLRGLIAVARASGEEHLSAAARCPQSNCGEIIEMDMELSAFLIGDGARVFDWSPSPEQKVSVALPTGADQQKWLQRNETTHDAMVRQLVQSVNGQTPAQDWQVPESWIDGLASELEQRDPLTALELEARCPACGAALAVEFDLEAELLKRLGARQARTLQLVHRLASVYHWSEAEILRLPAWRRNYYLNQLEGGR